MNKAMQLIRSPVKGDFTIGLILLDKLSKKEIYSLFESYGRKDTHNLGAPRECIFSLKKGNGEQGFKTYESRHGFWYLSQNDYTFIMNPSTSHVSLEYRDPIIKLYE